MPRMVKSGSHLAGGTMSNLVAIFTSILALAYYAQGEMGATVAMVVFTLCVALFGGFLSLVKAQVREAEGR